MYACLVELFDCVLFHLCFGCERGNMGASINCLTDCLLLGLQTCLPPVPGVVRAQLPPALGALSAIGCSAFSCLALDALRHSFLHAMFVCVFGCVLGRLLAYLPACLNVYHD